MTYRTLDPASIIRTLERLNARIVERFPARGLSNVCDELLALAQEDAGNAARLARPFWGLRFLITVILIGGAIALAYSAWIWRTLPPVEAETFSAFQGIEALMNIIILTGAGVWFLFNLETRIKRGRILADLHELRAIAHVIDMHQLTKDPMVALGRGTATASSPQRDMTAFELGRYLDYCSEMLSLIAKLAALYMATSRDPMVGQAVDEIQDLTTSLSGKIWQKILILDPGGQRPVSTPPTAFDAETGEDVVNRNCSPLHPFAIGD